MALTGNSTSGQTIKLTLPKILINGREVGTHVQKQDERLSYYIHTKQVATPAMLEFSTPDANVKIHYTFNGRTPTDKSPLYTGTPITLSQNSSGNGTVVKARAFDSTNPNKVSKIIKATINATGGNTYGSK